MSLKKLWNAPFILMLIFLITLAARLYFSFSTQYLDINAYFAVRQVEHIRETGFFLTYDPLSYGGRLQSFSHLFYYLLAFFRLFLPDFFVYKVLINIFASSLIFVTYFLSMEITQKKKEASFFASFVSGFIPIFFSKTFNNVSFYSLIIPLTFLLIYFFVKVEHSYKYVPYFLVTIALLRLSHPSAFLLTIVLVVYLIFIKVENVKVNRAEVELTLFSLFVIMWSLFITFKKAFLIHGQQVIWLNIPDQILSSYFKELSFFEIFSGIGIMPFIFGVYIIYKNIYVEKNKIVFLLSSFAITVFLLLLLKLIELETGLMFLGAILSILISKFYSLFFSYLEKTRISRFKFIFITGIILLFVVTSVIPSFYYAMSDLGNSLKKNELESLVWIKENTAKDSIVLSSVNEGHLINYFSERANVADSNFLLVKDANQRAEDIKTVYTTGFETESVRLLNKYNINYVYFSDRIKKEFNIKAFESGKYENCFKLVYDKQVKIYESICNLEEK